MCAPMIEVSPVRILFWFLIEFYKDIAAVTTCKFIKATTPQEVKNKCCGQIILIIIFILIQKL
jgi:hypothetical protein